MLDISPVPALAHPVDQETGGGHQGLHCGVVSPVLVQPDTLVEVEYISKLQELRESTILGLVRLNKLNTGVRFLFDPSLQALVLRTLSLAVDSIMLYIVSFSGKNQNYYIIQK